MSWQGIQRTITASTEPVTVVEARTHCSLDGADNDSILTTFITAARMAIENYLKRTINASTYVIAFDKFESVMSLPFPPVSAVSSVKYIDLAGVEQTLAISEYRVDIISQPARVSLEWNKSWPVTRSVSNAVKIEYVAGYTTCPAPVRIAIAMLTVDLFEHRGASSEISLKENDKYRNLLSAYTMPEFF